MLKWVDHKVSDSFWEKNIQLKNKKIQISKFHEIISVFSSKIQLYFIILVLTIFLIFIHIIHQSECFHKNIHKKISFTQFSFFNSQFQAISSKRTSSKLLYTSSFSKESKHQYLFRICFNKFLPIFSKSYVLSSIPKYLVSWIFNNGFTASTTGTFVNFLFRGASFTYPIID